MTKEKSVVVVTPFFDSFKRFDGSTLEVKLQLSTSCGAPASIPNLDALFNSPLDNPPMGKGLSNSEPLAGYLLESHLKRNGYNACTVFDWIDDTALNKALENDPMAVLFSTTFVMDRELLLKCVTALRKRIGSVPLIIGGPYIYKQAMALIGGFDHERAQALRSFGVDDGLDLLFVSRMDPILHDPIYVASPFGEYSVLRVLKALEGGAYRREDFENLGNLVLHQPDDTWRPTFVQEDPIDLDEDFTHWDLIENLPAVIPLRTSVGCPYRCNFCDFYLLHEKMFIRSIDSIIKELQIAKQLGRGFINFVDDNVFINEKRATNLGRAIIDNELDIVWGGFFRVDRVNEKNIDDIYESGCRFAICGIESGDVDQLKRMNRKCDLKQMHRGIDLATDAGINLALTFVVGFPGENKATLDGTADFINSLSHQNKGHALFEIYPFYLSPNAAADDPVFRKQYNLRGRYDRWSHHTMSFDEVIDKWAPYLFRQVDATPYSYFTKDSMYGWSTQTRNEVFRSRKELTDSFLSNASDDFIQKRFAALYNMMAQPGRCSSPPRWQDVLAGRAFQPGMNKPVCKES